MSLQKSTRAQRLVTDPHVQLALVGVAIAVALSFVRPYDRYPARNFTGEDGTLYLQVARALPAHILEHKLFHYNLQRTLPSAIVWCVSTLLRLPLDDHHAADVFRWLNASWLVVGHAFFLATLRRLGVSLRGAVLGTTLFFGNHFACRYAFYYPQMTDVTALGLGHVLAYAYVRRSRALILVVTILGTFTWPYLFTLLALPLMLFLPRSAALLDHAPRGREGRLGAILLGVLACYLVYRIYYGMQSLIPDRLPWLRDPFLDAMWEKEYKKPYAPLYALDWVPLAGAIAIASGVVPAARLLRGIELRDAIARSRPLVASLTAAIAVGIFFAQRRVAAFHPLEETLHYKLHIQHTLTLTRPLLAIVGHFAFLGPAAALFVLHWRGACVVCRRLGIGFALAATLLLMFLVCAETRQFLPGIGLLLPPLVKAVDDRGVRLGQIVVCAVAGLLTSKIWLFGGTDPAAWQHPLVREHFHEMPQQLYYMNIGVTMGMAAYKWHLAGLLVTVALLAIWRWRRPLPQAGDARWRRGITVAAVVGALTIAGADVLFAMEPRNVAPGSRVITADGDGAGASLVNGVIEDALAPGPERDDPWATVDLGRPVRIDRVHVYGMPGLTSLELSTSSDGVSFAPFASGTPFLNVVVPWRPWPDGRTARYVRVRQPGRGRLGVTEVEIAGH